MSAYNAVRFMTKPGREKDFADAHRRVTAQFPGLRKAALVQTGERSFCLIGEWADMDDLAAARPAMIAQLDSMRDMLEDLGNGLGLTDPVSGPAVVEIVP